MPQAPGWPQPDRAVNRLDVDGWEVAAVELDHSVSGRTLADQCRLFRSATAWTMVTISRHVRFDDAGQPADGHATITTNVFSSLEEVADHVDCVYIGDPWVELLDVGRGRDPDLDRAWRAVAERP